MVVIANGICCSDNDWCVDDYRDSGNTSVHRCVNMETMEEKHGRRRETLPPTRANKRRIPRLFEQNNAVEWETGIILFFRNVYILVCIVKRREK